MKSLRLIYSQEVDIRVGSLRVRRVRLSRHRPEASWIADHAHRHPQILLYMSGHGSQKFGNTTYPVRRGLAFFIPSGTRHAFIDAPGPKPLSLAIDLSVGDAHTKEVIVCQLNSMELNQVRHALSELTRWRVAYQTVEPYEAAAVLQLIDVLFRALGLPRAL